MELLAGNSRGRDEPEIAKDLEELHKKEEEKMKNIKWCWVATEVKGGWRLKLAYGKRDYNLVGAVFKTMKEVENITNGAKGGKIVFVHLKDTKFPEGDKQ